MFYFTERLFRKALTPLVFIFVIIFESNSGFATTCTAQVTGNWSANGTWKCLPSGTSPACSDTIIIPTSITVTVDVDVNLNTGACSGKPVLINISGTLFFSNNNELDLAAGSKVFIQVGGTLSSQNHGSNTFITIAGVTEWDGGNQGSTTGVGTVTSVSSGGIVAPIQLLSFKGLIKEKNVYLMWQTATEENNAYFTIEKSKDANVFTELGRIKGAGNSTEILNYSLEDNTPYSGVMYYRLKQTDYNGKSKTFNIISINPDNKGTTFIVYPNPNHGAFKAEITGTSDNQQIQLLMHDILGNLVYSGTFNTEFGITTVSVVPEQNIGKGIYFCSLVAEGIKYAVKVIVN